MLLNLLIQCLVLHLVKSHSDKPILIVVSYDGFRYDFLDKARTPSMMRLRREGVYADYMYNVFPTKTFTNHFSIATGMYAEEHGVVGNTFYDPELKRTVEMERAMFTQNPNVIPIWILNQMADRRRYSGCMMWPGCKFDYQNLTPTYFEGWDPLYDVYKRIDTAISWIIDPKYPANLVMIYIEEPDFHGHIYGPDSEMVANMIRNMDNVTLYLHEELKRKNLLNVTNVVHLGDHGMVSIKYRNILNITKYLEPGTYQFADYSPTLHVIPSPGRENDVYNRLKKAALEVGHFSVYKKRDVPQKWHFRKNIRAPPILLLANKGYVFQDFYEMVKKYQVNYKIKVTPNTMFGVHGYSTNIKEMYSFFMARGPKLRKNHELEPFNSVDLYSVFAAILEVPSGRSKNVDLIDNVLEVSGDSYMLKVVIVTVGGILLSLTIVGCAVATTVVLIKRQQNLVSAAALNKRFPQSYQQAVEAQHLLDTEDA